MNIKRILSIIMALCAIAGLVLGTQTEVSAKNQKSPTLTLTFNGGTITLDFVRATVDDKKDSKEPKTLAEVEEKFGKRSKMEEEKIESPEDETLYWYTYTWKKGKTKISISDNPQIPRLKYATIDIKDKNGAINGIKVGMPKAKAVKILKKQYGNKNVSVSKKSISAAFQLIISLKNNKVSEIHFMRS